MEILVNVLKNYFQSHTNNFLVYYIFNSAEKAKLFLYIQVEKKRGRLVDNNNMFFIQVTFFQPNEQCFFMEFME